MYVVGKCCSPGVTKVKWGVVSSRSCGCIRVGYYEKKSG